MHYLSMSLIAAVSWGIFPLLDRYLSLYLNGVTMAFARGLVIGVVSIIMFTVFFLYKKTNLSEGYQKGGKMLIAILILSPLIAFGIGHLCFYSALAKARTSLIQIFLITHCLPIVIVTIFATIIYKDKLCWQMVLGILLSLLGISLTVIYNPNHTMSIQ